MNRHAPGLRFSRGSYSLPLQPLPVNLTRVLYRLGRCRFPASQSSHIFSSAPPSLLRPPAVWLTHGATSPQHLGTAGTSPRALTATCSSSVLELQMPREPPQPNRV